SKGTSSTGLQLLRWLCRYCVPCLLHHFSSDAPTWSSQTPPSGDTATAQPSLPRAAAPSQHHFYIGHHPPHHIPTPRWIERRDGNSSPRDVSSPVLMRSYDESSLFHARFFAAPNVHFI